MTNFECEQKLVGSTVPYTNTDIPQPTDIVETNHRLRKSRTPNQVTRSNKGKFSGERFPIKIITNIDKTTGRRNGSITIILDMKSKDLQDYVPLKDDDGSDGYVKLFFPFFQTVNPAHKFYLTQQPDPVTPENQNPIEFSLKRENGEFVTGTLYWNKTLVWQGNTYTKSQVRVWPQYDHDSDETFGRINYGDFDPSVIGHDNYDLPSRFVGAPGEVDPTPSVPPIEKNYPLAGIVFETDEEYFDRPGISWLIKNPKALDGFHTPIPLTPNNCEKLKNTPFESMINAYQCAVNFGKIPARCHCLFIGNFGIAATILNTRKPRIVSDRLALAKKYKARNIIKEKGIISGTQSPSGQTIPIGYVEIMQFAKDWQAFKARSPSSLLGMHNHYVLTSNLSARIKNKHIHIVEGPNDALALYSQLSLVDSEAVTICISTNDLYAGAIERLTPYVDWKNCSYTVFLDKFEYSMNVQNTLQKLCGVSKQAINVAQNIYGNLSDGDDPEEFFIKNDVNINNVNEFDFVLPETVQERSTWSLDADEAYTRLNNLQKIFTIIDPEALVKAEIIESVDQFSFDSMTIGVDQYNALPPILKDLAYATDAIDITSQLELSKPKDNLTATPCSWLDDDTMLTAQGNAKRCKVTLSPISVMPKCYFDFVSWNDDAKSVWEQCNHDYDLVRLEMQKSLEAVHIASSCKSTKYNADGSSVNVISESFSQRRGCPSLRYCVVVLGGGKTLSLHAYVVEQQIRHLHEVYEAIKLALDSKLSLKLDFADTLRVEKFKAESKEGEISEKDLEAATDRMSAWARQIEPAINTLSATESWIGKSYDFSLMQVEAGTMFDMLEILIMLYGYAPISDPSLILVKDNRELDAFASLFSSLKVDSSTFPALNDHNITETPTRSATLRSLPGAIITQARFKNGNCPTYMGNSRLVISDERLKVDMQFIPADLADQFLKLVREADDTSHLLVDGFVDRPTGISNDNDEAITESKVYEGCMHRLTAKLKYTLIDIFESLQTDIPAHNRPASEGRSHWSRIINLLDVRASLPDELFTVPFPSTRAAHNTHLQDVAERLAELAITVALNQPELTYDEESGTANDRNIQTSQQFQIAATTNEMLILDGTALVLNPELSQSFNHLRIAYPKVDYVLGKKILSHNDIVCDPIPLTGVRHSNCVNNSTLHIQKTDSEHNIEVVNISSEIISRSFENLLNSRRMQFLTKENFNDIVDLVYNTHFLLSDLDRYVKKRQVVKLTSFRVELLSEPANRERYKIEDPSNGDRIQLVYGSSLISFKLTTKTARKESRRFDKTSIVNSIALESAYDYGVSIVNADNESFAGISDWFLDFNSDYHHEQNTDTLMFMHTKSKNDYSEKTKTKDYGNGVETNHEGSNIELFDIRRTRKENKSSSVGHSTSHATGSNRYRNCGLITIIGEPWFPSFATTSSRGIVGQGAKPRFDMLASMIQANGRGTIRQGSSRHCLYQKTMLFDVPLVNAVDSTNDEHDVDTPTALQRFIDDYTLEVRYCRPMILDIAINSFDTEKLTSLYNGSGISGTSYDRLTPVEHEIIKNILHERLDMQSIFNHNKS